MTPRTPLLGIERALDAAIMTFDLPEQLARLKGEEAWRRNGRNAITLHKSPGQSLVLATLRAGAAIPRHEAAYPVSLLVLEGRLQLGTPSGTVRLGQGRLVALHPGVAHDIEAQEEAAFLLLLASHEEHPAVIVPV